MRVPGQEDAWSVARLSWHVQADFESLGICLGSLVVCLLPSADLGSRREKRPRHRTRTIVCEEHSWQQRDSRKDLSRLKAMLSQARRKRRGKGARQ
eukprot:6092098-Pleurochrysis_carterae.AAC.1